MLLFTLMVSRTKRTANLFSSVSFFKWFKSEQMKILQIKMNTKIRNNRKNYAQATK